MRCRARTTTRSRRYTGSTRRARTWRGRSDKWKRFIRKRGEGTMSIETEAGQVLVKIDPRDYQAALDQAKAALALAESEARSAGVDVPRTRENVASGNSSADAQLQGAQADLARAQSTYEQAQTADLAWAQANVEKSQANAELAKADLARYTPLMQKGEISKQQYDAAKANADASASALRADQEKLAQAQRNVDVSKAQLDAARARG